MHFVSLQNLWESEVKPMPLLIVVVPALPKNAAVELHVTAVEDDPSQRTSYHITTNVAHGSIECHTVLSADGCSGSLSLSLDVLDDKLEASDVKRVREEVGTLFVNAMKMMNTQLLPQCARVFYKCSHPLVHQIVDGIPSKKLLPNSPNFKGGICKIHFFNC